MSGQPTLAEPFSSYLDAFIKEVNPFTTREQIFLDMNVFPIIIAGAAIGIIGISTEKNNVGKYAKIRLIYIAPQYRGKYLKEISVNLVQRFAEQGFTHIEAWALPGIGKWLERRYSIRPKLRVYHEAIGRIQESHAK